MSHGPEKCLTTGWKDPGIVKASAAFDSSGHQRYNLGPTYPHNVPHGNLLFSFCLSPLSFLFSRHPFVLSLSFCLRLNQARLRRSHRETLGKDLHFQILRMNHSLSAGPVIPSASPLPDVHQEAWSCVPLACGPLLMWWCTVPFIRQV